jgi:hypothetical protein
MQIHGSQFKSVVLGHRVPTQDFFFNLVVHYHIPGQLSFMTFVNHLRCLFNVQCELCLVTCHDSGCCPKFDWSIKATSIDHRILLRSTNRVHADLDSSRLSGALHRNIST